MYMLNKCLVKQLPKPDRDLVIPFVALIYLCNPSLDFSQIRISNTQNLNLFHMKYNQFHM